MMKYSDKHSRSGLYYVVSGSEYLCEAQITVMAALVFMIVISFVTTCVNAAAMSGYNTIIKQACSLSDESVFTAYNNDLLEQYDIFALKKSDIINDKVYQYIKTNINTYSKDIDIISGEYNSYGYMTEDGGYGVEEQIVRYMQSGGYADIITNYNNVSESIKQSACVTKVTDNIVAAKDTAYQGWKELNKLLVLCKDISDKEDEITDCMDSYGKEYLKAEDESRASIILNKLSKQLGNMSAQIRDMSDKASGSILSFEEYKNRSEQSMRECYEKLESSRKLLGETLYQELYNDIEAMSDGQDSTELPSVNDIKEAIYSDNSFLDKMSEDSQLIAFINTKAEEGSFEGDDFRVRILSDKYSSYITKNDNYDNSAGVLKQLYSLLKEGIAGLVIQKDISDKSIDYEDLANRTVTGNSKDTDITNMAVRSALVNEYILSRCVSYIDYVDETPENSKKRTLKAGVERKLDYEIEYILCGEKSDRDNLKGVLTKLSIAREGVNLSYLITDSVRKNECFALSLELLGYTGNMPLIKAVQYLIMSVWAYVESIVELREVYKGGSIDIVKSADNWRTDIGGIMGISNKKVSSAAVQAALSKWDNNADNKSNKSDGLGSLDYNGCLRLLLLIQNRINKNAHIMSVMELMMMSLGHSGFRMKEYIYRAEGEAVFSYVRNKQTYRQKLMYSYA